MMFELAVLGLGWFLVGLSFAYLLWGPVREISLKQDLFEIRNLLWEAARKYDSFDDPAYIDARRVLNDCIYTGYIISLPMLIAYAVLKPRESMPAPKKILASNPGMQVEIAHGMRQTERRLKRYLLHDRPLSTLPILWFVGGVTVIKGVIEAWFSFEGPRHFAFVKDSISARGC